MSRKKSWTSGKVFFFSLMRNHEFKINVQAFHYIVKIYYFSENGNFKGAGYTPVRVIHRFQKHIPSILGGAGYTPVRVIHR